MFGFGSRNKEGAAQDSPPLPSELRQDVVTGDWVVIARARSKRPSDFSIQKAPREDEASDPFADPQAAGNKPAVLRYEDERGEWTVQVIPNKYPAFSQHGEGEATRQEGPFSVVEGRGYHEVVITRDAQRDFSQMSEGEASDAVRALHERFITLAKDEKIRYISLFQNHGVEAGASIAHPHLQIIAIPVVPTGVRRSLGGARRYARRNERRVHEDIMKWEREEGVRILFENEHFVVFCPFVSRVAFEIRIFPKEHQYSFAQLRAEQYASLGNALRGALSMLEGTLGDPAYNFFVHSSPINDDRDHTYYQWHIEILPKTATWAGFELGTGIEISSIEPERAAEFLRERRPDWIRIK